MESETKTKEGEKKKMDSFLIQQQPFPTCRRFLAISNRYFQFVIDPVSP